MIFDITDLTFKFSFKLFTQMVNQRVLEKLNMCIKI